jgi:hypothetical protein
MAKKNREITFTKVAAIGRRRLNPYTGEFMQIDEPYVLDSDKADMLSAMGEVKIIEENVVPPWVKKEEPKKEIVNEKVKTEAQAQAKT